MPPKNIQAFCSPECCIVSAAVSEASHSHASPSRDGTQPRASLSNSEVQMEDIGRTVHIYFSSANKMSRPNEQQKH